MPQAKRQAVNMVHGQLETNSVLDRRLLGVLKAIPREDFVPPQYRKAAYIDRNIEIGKNRYLLEPMAFGKLLNLAAITPSCRALIIGSGNGYATAIISELAGHVVAIESDGMLMAQALEHMARLKISDVNNQSVKNMADGYQLSAPFDVIFINGGIGFLPDALPSQLAIGGRLVAIKSITDCLGKGILVQRVDGKVNVREHFDATAAILPSFEKPQLFSF